MTAQVSKLPNGLTVATDPMASVETVSVGVWVGTGTRSEPAEVNGAAHFLEHMAFKGTEKRTALSIAEEIEAVGGHLNAYTSRENTAYYARVLADDMPLAVDIIADILQNSTFDAEEFERERHVILQEIGQANDTPDDIIFDHFQEAAFSAQAMGRPVLGTSEIIRGISRDSVRDFMQDRYSADRMVLTASGKVEHESLVKLAEEMFSGMPARNGLTDEAGLYTGGEYREVREAEQVHVILGFEGPGYHAEDYYSAHVFSGLFGGGMSSRLFQEVREKRGLVYSIYSFVSSYTDSGVFGIYAGTGEDEADILMSVIGDEIAKICDGVRDEEIDRAKAQLRASLLMARESTSARAEHLGQQQLIFGRPVPVEEQLEKIAAVDRKAVMDVAQRIFASPPTMAALGPISRLETRDVFAERL